MKINDSRKIYYIDVRPLSARLKFWSFIEFLPLRLYTHILTNYTKVSVSGVTSTQTINQTMCDGKKIEREGEGLKGGGIGEEERGGEERGGEERKREGDGGGSSGRGRDDRGEKGAVRLEEERK